MPAVKPMVSKTLIGLLLSAGLTACATAPSKPVEQAPADVPLTPAFSSASTDFKTRQYAAAVGKFDAIIADPGTPAKERRLAHLGKALVYLSYDEEWRSIQNARDALGQAAKVPVPAGETLDIETDMLMESILAQIDSQSVYDNMKSQTKDSGYQVAQLEKKQEALEKERDALIKENENLNQALERLKNLTLGD